jgi:hypothetical protein
MNTHNNTFCFVNIYIMLKSYNHKESKNKWIKMQLIIQIIKI